MSVRKGPNDVGGRDCDCPDLEVWGVLTWLPKSWPNYRDDPNMHIGDIYTSEEAARGSIPTRAAGRQIHAIDDRTYGAEGWVYRVVKIRPRCGHEPTLRNVLGRPCKSP